MADEPQAKPPLAARIEQNFDASATDSPSQPCPNPMTVGDPGLWGLVPVIGSGWAAINDFQNGRWGPGLLQTVLAITDIVPVKALAVAGGKLVFKLAAKVVVKEAVETVEKQVVKEVVKDVEKQVVERIPQKGKYSRPGSFRKGVRDDVWESAKGKDGIVRDPQTKQIMDKSEPWEMGHKPGYEFRKHAESAQERNISRKDFLNEHNKRDHYQPELPSSNHNHKGEDMTSRYEGP